MAYEARPAQLPLWGTGVGSNVVTGLTATAAQFESVLIEGRVQYGLIKYSFSGSPNLSSVLPGQVLNVTSGFTNPENNGSGKEVHSKDNTAKTITVKTTDRAGAGLDETGVTAAATVTTDGSKITEPSEAKKAHGFRAPEKPGDGTWNWVLNRLYQWIKWANENAPVGYLWGEKLTAGDGIALADNGDNTLLITATTPSFAPLADAVGKAVTQASHGFAVKDQIRHNGTTWVKAQANSIAGCTDTWFVSAVADASNFTAVKSGRVTVAGHGLTSGTLYYLSADTAGLLTPTMPVGNTTRALGYYLPVLYVESANVVHVLGNSLPTFNPVYAEKVITSSGSFNSAAFTFPVNFANIGNSLTAECTGVTAFPSSNFGLKLKVVTSSGNVEISAAPGDNGSAGDEFGSRIKIMSYPLANRVFLQGFGFIISNTDIAVNSSHTLANNITSVQFFDSNGSNSPRVDVGDYARLLIDRMPAA